MKFEIDYKIIIELDILQIFPLNPQTVLETSSPIILWKNLLEIVWYTAHLEKCNWNYLHFKQFSPISSFVPMQLMQRVQGFKVILNCLIFFQFFDQRCSNSFKAFQYFILTVTRQSFRVIFHENSTMFVVNLNTLVK